MIPRTIHWIWLSDMPLGETVKRCVDSWKRHATDFRIRRWGMDDFDMAQMPRWVHEAIVAKKWAFACDYLRLWVLAHEGGWYLDSDVLMRKSPAAFEDHGFVSAIEYYPGMDYPSAIQAAAMGCEVGHPFVVEALGWYERAPFVLPDGSYNTARLAPHILADMARARGFVWQDKRQELRDGMLLLPSHVFAPRVTESSCQSSLIHLCAGSWRGYSEEERSGIDRMNARLILESTTAFGWMYALLRRIKRFVISRQAKVLYLSAEYAPGTGGAVIAGRHQRWLKETYGEEGCRKFELRWYVFDPLRFRKNTGQKLRTLVWRVIETLKWHMAFARYRPAVVFIDGSHLHVPSFRFLGRFPTIVFYHNVEQDYRRQSEPDYVSVVTEIERRLTQGVTVRICLTERDSDRLRELYGKGADFLMPTTMIDRLSFVEDQKDDGYLLFVGSDFFGNTEGLFWFVENCLAKTDERLLVVGNGMERYRGKFAELESQGKLEFHGFVDDLSAVYRRAKAVVLPITSGGGMKTKTAEALMYDKLVYGTDEAFVGYEGIDEVAVRCNSADEYVRALTAMDRAIRKGAREYFLAHCEDGVGKRRFMTWMRQWT